MMCERHGSMIAGLLLVMLLVGGEAWGRAGGGEKPWRIGVSAAKRQRALALFRQGNALIIRLKHSKALALYREAIRYWDHPSIQFNIAQCLIGFWIVVIPSNLDASPIGWRIGLVLVGIGLAALAAQLLMNWSFGLISIATGSLLGMLTPIFNVFIGLALFGETLTSLGILGTLLILVSCTGVVIWGGDGRGTRKQRKQPAD